MIACGQENDQSGMIKKLKEFKDQEKFNEDMKIFYPGLADEKLKDFLTQNINLAADDFIEVAQLDNPTDKEYLDKIRTGLSRFPNDLDTEDRERVAQYFEELMDIVGLESSGGLLNKFVYGFDPNE
jgi:hypothetical protein